MADETHGATGTDRELIAGAVAGDRECYGALVERYWRIAVARAMARTRDSAEAEDVAQESFITAYRYLGTLRDYSRFGGWLSRIIAQKSIDVARKKSRQHPTDLNTLPEELFAWGPSRDPALANEEAEIVRDAVGRLPERFRTVIILRFVGGLSTGAIAEQLGKPPATVRGWLHRAYRKLEKDLARFVREGR